MIAFTVGAATLATLHWLQDVCTRISGTHTPGTATPSDAAQPWSSPGPKTLTPAHSQPSDATSPAQASPTAAAAGILALLVDMAVRKCFELGL